MHNHSGSVTCSLDSLPGWSEFWFNPRKRPKAIYAAIRHRTTSAKGNEPFSQYICNHFVFRTHLLFCRRLFRTAHHLRNNGKHFFIVDDQQIDVKINSSRHAYSVLCKAKSKAWNYFHQIENFGSRLRNIRKHLEKEIKFVLQLFAVSKTLEGVVEDGKGYKEVFVALFRSDSSRCWKLARCKVSTL